MNPALQPQGQLPLSWLDPDPLAQRFVFEAPGHIHQDITAGKPPLAGPVDVGIVHLSQANVASDVDVPAVHPRVDLAMVAMGLVGDSFGRAKVDAAGNRLSGVLVPAP